jgi:hypothetical protein
MPYLEQVGLAHRWNQQRLGGPLDIARQDCGETTVLQAQDYGVVIGIQMAIEPVLPRVQHFESHRVDRENISPSGSTPLRTVTIKGLQILPVQGGAVWLPRV